MGWICLLYSRAGLTFKLLYCNYVSGASETQNCRNSIIAQGRQEVAYGSVEIDCPGVFSVAFCHFRIFCILMRYCWLLNVPSLLIPSVHLLSPVKCTACTLGPALRASWLQFHMLKAGELRWDYFVVPVQRAEVLIYQNKNAFAKHSGTRLSVHVGMIAVTKGLNLFPLV